MHEHGITDRLMKEAQAKAAGRHLEKIARITIGIGALSGLSPESLAEPLHHAAEEMGLAGVEFTFTRVLPTAVCRVCSREIGQEYTCPFCGSADIEIKEGMEAVVLGVE